MSKNVLRFRQKMAVLLCCLISTAPIYAQYATSGVGRYKNQIFWLDWQQKTAVNDANNTTVTGLISSPKGDMQQVGSTIKEGAYTWNINPGKVRVQGTISNLTSVISGVTNPINYLKTVIPGTLNYSTGFKNMYGGLNAVGIAGYSNIGKLDLQLTLQVFNGSNWIDIKTPGMIIADAESLTNTNMASDTNYILNPKSFGDTIDNGRFEYFSATIPDQQGNGIGWEQADYNIGDNTSGKSSYKMAYYHPSTTNGKDSLRLLAYNIGTSTDKKESVVFFCTGNKQVDLCSHKRKRTTDYRYGLFHTIRPW